MIQIAYQFTYSMYAVLYIGLTYKSAYSFSKHGWS